MKSNKFTRASIRFSKMAANNMYTIGKEMKNIIVVSFVYSAYFLTYSQVRKILNYKVSYRVLYLC